MWRLWVLFLVQFSTCVISSTSMDNNQLGYQQTSLMEPFAKVYGWGCEKMCCSGRNNTCVSKGRRMGGKGSDHDRCYCDEGCLDMKDCCEDYSASCEAVDCEVGEWEDYGVCSKDCGIGAKTRYRQVVREPRNGGMQCPTLRETTVCLGTRCKTTRHLGGGGHKFDREYYAKIMPASWGKYRELKAYDPSQGILKNLFERYYAKEAIGKTGYCSKFRITAGTVACQSNVDAPWASVFREGAVVCVECQPTAMEKGPSDIARCAGHGRLEANTSWRGVNTHNKCFGWWKRISDLSECKCDSDDSHSFIFV